MTRSYVASSEHGPPESGKIPEGMPLPDFIKSKFNEGYIHIQIEHEGGRLIAHKPADIPAHTTSEIPPVVGAKTRDGDSEGGGSRWWMAWNILGIVYGISAISGSGMMKEGGVAFLGMLSAIAIFILTSSIVLTGKLRWYLPLLISFSVLPHVFGIGVVLFGSFLGGFCLLMGWICAVIIAEARIGTNTRKGFWITGAIISMPALALIVWIGVIPQLADMRAADARRSARTAESARQLREPASGVEEKESPSQTGSNADCVMGNIYDAGKDYVSAAASYRKAADQGNAEAQTHLGFYYMEGKGVSQDFTQAVALSRLAADQGIAMAQYNLGVCYMNGLGVAKDEIVATELYHKAAKQGYSLAQTWLAYSYMTGKGVQRNDELAVSWLQKAADQSDVDGEFLLGCCYAEGQGVPKDNTKASLWFRKAADQGRKEAQSAIGECYEKGMGVSRNNTLAYMWYNLAAVTGDAEAVKSRDRVGAQLTPSLLAEAQRMSREWKPTSLITP